MKTSEKCNTATFASLIFVTVLSLAGIVLSLHLADLHYKHPGRVENLVKNFPAMKFLQKTLPAKYLKSAPKSVIDEPVNVEEEIKNQYDPFEPYNNKPAGAPDPKFAKPEKEACDINETFSCGEVDKSIYSEMPVNSGVGVSLYGVFGYLILFILGIVSTVKRPSRPGVCIMLIYAGSAVGFAFSIYLTYLEAYKIKAYCPYCVASAAVMAVIFLIMTTGFSKGIFRKLAGKN